MYRFKITRLPGIRACAFAGMLAATPLVAAPVTIDDANGRTVTIADSQRVISAGGSVTEILYALGLEDRIIAVDTTSRYPADALNTKPDVGYLRALSAEGLLSVSPSLILAEADAGPAETVSILQNASVPFVSVPAAMDAAGVADKIRFVANAMDVAARGEDLASAVTADLTTVTGALNDAIKSADDRPRTLFILSLSGGRILAAGADTSAAAMIELAGGRNALTGFSGYKPVNDEAVIGAAPEVIIMMDRGDHRAEAADVFSQPALALTPAARSRRLVRMDGLYLLGFGPRIAHAVRDLAAALHPDLDLPTLADRSWTAADAASQ